MTYEPKLIVKPDATTPYTVLHPAEIDTLSDLIRKDDLVAVVTRIGGAIANKGTGARLHEVDADLHGGLMAEVARRIARLEHAVKMAGITVPEDWASHGNQ